MGSKFLALILFLASWPFFTPPLHHSPYFYIKNMTQGGQEFFFRLGPIAIIFIEPFLQHGMYKRQFVLSKWQLVFCQEVDYVQEATRFWYIVQVMQFAKISSFTNTNNLLGKVDFGKLELNFTFLAKLKTVLRQDSCLWTKNRAASLEKSNCILTKIELPLIHAMLFHFLQNDFI